MSDPLQTVVQRCADDLEDALDRPAEQLSDEVDQVEQRLADVRDVLIERVHTGRGAADRGALDRINAVLSLVVGVEYPSAGIPRQLLQQARAALSDLLAQHVLEPRA